ncbi:protein kinase [Gracilaria domingensis]|nr:protein kinase [Gracilaria domingensis]
MFLLLLVLLSFIRIIAEEIDCLPGQVRGDNDGDCIDCPPGTYADPLNGCVPCKIVVYASLTPLAMRKVLGSVNRVLPGLYLLEVLRHASPVRLGNSYRVGTQLARTVSEEASRIGLILCIVTLAQTEQLPLSEAAPAYQIAFHVPQIAVAIVVSVSPISTNHCKKMSAGHARTEVSPTQAAPWGFRNACPVHRT